ncbi:MAG: PQQ-binding-like beta-propeller repeat protein [Planctomycetaceae bacterium]|nr:PQQ-binding-like beta-propeller repeat protein [Planctomycetaceae bacterium]
MKNAVATLVVTFSLAVSAAADVPDWPSWRGPLNHGSVADGDYPVKFGADEHLWRTSLPGRGCSTPILLDGKIYLTSPAEGNDALLCYDLGGKELWRTVFGAENPGKHRNGSGSNASPVTDGQAIFVYYKSGTFAAVDRDGGVRWKTNLVERFGPDTLFWDHGTSPVVTEKHVVMARMHQGESWLAAFDKATGKLAWKVARNYTTPVECDHGYSTPVVMRHNGKESLLVWGAEHLTIHDAADGQVVWSCGGFNPDGNKLWPAIVTPVVVGDMAIVAYGRNDRGLPRLYGVRLTGRGDVTATHQIWKRDDVGTFVPTPVVHQGRVILVRDRGEVACLDPETGKTVWDGAFPKHRTNFYASPLVAGDKLYAPREDGIVFVAKIGDGRLELLAENDMGESVIGSPIPAAGRVLLRGETHLFCVSGRQAAK